MVHVANFILVAGVLPGDRHSFEDQSLADIVRSPGGVDAAGGDIPNHDLHRGLQQTHAAHVADCGFHPVHNQSVVCRVGTYENGPAQFPHHIRHKSRGAFLHLHRTPDGDLHFDPAQTLHEHHDRNLLLVGVRNSNALSPEPTVRRLHHHGPAVVAHLHPPDRAPHPHHDQRAHEEHVHEGRAELAGEAPARIREEAKGRT
jgi:hypothetical protein